MTCCKFKGQIRLFLLVCDMCGANSELVTHLFLHYSMADYCGILCLVSLV